VWDETLHAEAERKLRAIDSRWNTPEAEVCAHIQEARVLVVEAAKRLQATEAEA